MVASPAEPEPDPGAYAATDALMALGYDDRVATRWAALGGLGPAAVPGVVPARVTRVERGAVTVAGAEGASLVRTGTPLAVGDWVALDTRGADRRIVAVLDRWSALTRADPAGGVQVLAADIDLVLSVTPADRSSAARVEREMVLAWDSGARPAVVVTKADRPEAGEVVHGLQARLAGVPVIPTSAVTRAGLDAVRAELGRGTCVLLGPSGAGKSSLLNALCGAERMAVGEVRTGDRRGRHTTTSRQLFCVPGGGVVIDTPGLRSLGLVAAGADDGIARTFADVEERAARCRFRDCRHDGEPGCAVVAAVESGDLSRERLAGYRKLQRERAHDEARRDPIARRAQQQRWKAIGRAMKDVPPKR